MSRAARLVLILIGAVIVGAVGVVVLLVIVATTYTPPATGRTSPTTAPRVETPAPTPSPTAAPSRPRASSSEYLACRDFTALANEAGKGLLTDREIRDRLRDVYDTAAAEPSTVSLLAETLLRMTTQGETGSPAYGDTIGTLLRECIAVADSRR